MKLVNTHRLLLILLITIIGLNKAQARVWTLQQCLDTALVYNKTLMISRNNIALGEQKAKEAAANLFPKITANADYKYITNLPYQLMPLSTFNPAASEGQFKEAQFGVPHNINANLQLSMPLYNPQVYGAIQSTKIASQLSELQYKKTEEQIYYEILNLYYNAQILHNQLEFIDNNIINAERLLKNVQLLNEQLLATGTDVSRVNLQIAQLTTHKESVKGKFEQVLNALKLTIGVPIEQNLQIEPKIKFYYSGEYESSTTLDLQLAKTRNNLISSELSTLNKSRYLPSLNLIGVYGTTGYGYDKQPNDFLKFFPSGFVGIQLSYTLFNGTVTGQKINQKEFELQNSELQFDLISEQNNMQIENAKLQRAIAEKSVETTTQQIELAKNIFEQTILQQKQGIANLTDVLLADNALRTAQQSYLSSIIDYLKADLELKKETGNLSINK